MATNFPFTNLVFEGGGVKGVAYVGALRVLEQRGIMPQIKRVAGTSAGAITAACVAMGFTSDQLEKLLMDLDFTTFMDGMKLDGPLRVVEKYGWFKGNAFHAWMSEQVKSKLDSPTATFADLQARHPFDLRIVATDLSLRSPAIFSKDTTPQTPIADAVRCSMSIPLFFEAVKVQDNVYVDGGAVWNYPIEMFDDAPDGAPSATGVNMATLGFRLGPAADAPPTALKIDDIGDYAKALFEALMDIQDNFFRRFSADGERTVHINNLGLVATDFSITTDKKQALIVEGAKGTTDYLDQLEPTLTEANAPPPAAANAPPPKDPPSAAHPPAPPPPPPPAGP